MAILCCCIIFSLNSNAQDCDDLKLSEQYNRILVAYRQFEMEEIPLLADSIIFDLSSSNLEHCKLYFWARYYKAESMERSGDFEAALSVYFDMIDKILKLEYYDIAASTYISMARVYENIERPKDCAYNLQKAKKLIDKYNINSARARHSVRSASYHRIYENRDSAIMHALNAIKMAHDDDDDVRSQTDGNLLLGILYIKTEQKAFYFREAIKFFLENKNYSSAAYQEINLARLYHKNKDNENAILHLNRASRHTLKIRQAKRDESLILVGIYELRSRIADSQGNIKDADFYLKKQMEVERNRKDKTNQKNINELQVQYAEQKSQKIISRTKWISFIVSMGLLTLAVFTLLLLKIQRDTKRANKIISKKNTIIEQTNRDLSGLIDKQAVLMSEIHHRIKNNLQFVISLLTLYGVKSKELELKQKFEEVSQKVLSVAIIHEQLYKTKEFTQLNIRIYIEQIVSQFSTFLPVDAEIEVQSEDLFLNLDTILPIAIVCSELMANSVKHAVTPSKKLVCSILISKQYETHTLKYQDNGPGYSSDNIVDDSSKMGMFLIASMTKQLGATSRAEIDNGLLFIMKFKEKESPIL